MFKRNRLTNEEKALAPPKPRQMAASVYRMFNILLPIILLLFIRTGLVELSVLVVILSKWRVFTVRPRHLLANIRSNSVDIIVKLSTLSFMIQAAELIWLQLLLTAWYITWLVFIKPGSSTTFVSIQAIIAQTLGLSAVFYHSNTLNISVILLLAWFVGVSCARHFIGSYEEKEAAIIAAFWGMFVLQLSWVLSKWMLVYLFVPQLVFILLVMSYGLGTVYDRYKKDTLKPSFVSQQMIMTFILIVLLAIVGDWHGQI